MKTIIDESTNQRFHAILDELALPLTADASSVRRLHDAAKAITVLADSIGRHERVDFDEVWPKSMADKKIGRKCLPLFLGLTSTDEKLVTDLASLPHLLVGGATGQGKSNLLNSIICGLTRLCRQTNCASFLWIRRWLSLRLTRRCRILPSQS